MACRRRHFLGDGRGHVLGKIHHVIGRQFCQLARGPALQRIGLVVFPVRALVMIVAAQEIMHALRRAVHVGVGLPRRIVPLIMFSRPRQRREFAMHGIFRLRFRRRIRGVERQRRRSGERRAHQRDRPEHVGPHQRAPGRDRTAEIMSDHRIDMAIAERRHQPERVAHQIEQPERAEVAVVTWHPSRWCGHSRAGPARSRDSRRQPAPASPCAS